MKTSVIGAVMIAIFLASITIVEGSEIPQVEWNETYGESTYSIARQLMQTSDGGYVFCGERFTEDIGAGDYDFWLVKLDQNGTIIWNTTYGGEKSDVPLCFVQAIDEGYVLAGYSFSNSDYQEILVIKTDDEGLTEWQQYYNLGVVQWPTSIIAISDGFLLSGNVDTTGEGTFDMLLMKIDDEGNIIWNVTYGGSGPEEAKMVVQTNDGGFIIAASTSSYGEGGADYYLIKTDHNGLVEWEKTYGDTGTDVASSVVQTQDQGYAIFGSTNSYGVNDYDFWLVKTDANGTMEWNRTYGGKQKDISKIPKTLIQTTDGGFALVGYSNHLFYLDFLLVKTDQNGYMQWSNYYTGNGDIRPYSLVQTNDEGYAISGYVVDLDHKNSYVLKLQNASNDQNLYPIAHAGEDVIATIGTALTFDASESYDPDGEIIQYQWDFDGNGAFDWSSTTTGAITHAYTEAGTYDAILEVTDTNGSTRIDIKKIQITGEIQDAVSQGQLSGEMGIGIIISVFLFVLLVISFPSTKKQKKAKTLRRNNLASILHIDTWNGRLLLCFFLILSIKTTISLLLTTPSIYVDEHAYGIMASQIFQGDFSVIQSTPISSAYPAGYPYVLSPAYLLGNNMDSVYHGMLFINCLLSSLLIFPIYFIMKNFVNEKQALLTSFIVAFLPTVLIHSTLLMSENAFYLLFLVSLVLVMKTFSYEKFDRTFVFYAILLGFITGFLIMIKATGIAMLAALLCLFIYRVIKAKKRSSFRYVLIFLPLLLFVLYIILNPGFLERYSFSQYLNNISLAFSDVSLFTQFISVVVNEINYLVSMSFILFMAFTIFLLLNRKQLTKKIHERVSILSIYGLFSTFFLILLTAIHLTLTDLSVYSRYVSVGLPVFFMLGVIGIQYYDEIKNKKKALHLSGIFVLLGLFFIFLFPGNITNIMNNLDIVWIIAARDFSISGIDGFSVIQALFGILVIIITILSIRAIHSKKHRFPIEHVTKHKTILLLIILLISLVLYLPSAEKILSEQSSVMETAHNGPARWLMENDPDALVVLEDSYTAYLATSMYDLDWQFIYVNMFFWLPNGDVNVMDRNELRTLISTNELDADYLLSTYDLTQYYPIDEDITMNIPTTLEENGEVNWYIYKINDEIR